MLPGLLLLLFAASSYQSDILRLNAGVVFKNIGKDVSAISDTVIINFNVKLIDYAELPLVAEPQDHCKTVKPADHKENCATLLIMMRTLHGEVNDHILTVNRLRTEYMNMRNLFIQGAQNKRGAFLQPIGDFFGRTAMNTHDLN